MDGSEGRTIAVENPRVADAADRIARLACSSEVAALVIDSPNRTALKSHDGVYRPTFKELPEAFSPGQGIVDRQCEAVPNVEVAVAVQRSGICSIDRCVEAIAFIIA